MHHIFDVQIATEYGVNVAIFLNNLGHWIQKNIANDNNYHDGHYWTYNKLDAYTVLFPYWTRRQVENIINKCEEHGLVLKGNHNKVKYDRTCWYALTEKGLKLLNIIISPKCEMEITEKGNGNHQTVTPIPNINTYINTDNKSYCSSKDELQSYFNDFWKLYPRKQKKKRSQEIWEKQKLDRFAKVIIDSLTERLKTEWLDKEKQFIPLPDSFLNGRRWEDEIIVDQKVKQNGQNYKNHEHAKEIKSTVPWYIPDPMYN